MFHKTIKGPIAHVRAALATALTYLLLILESIERRV